MLDTTRMVLPQIPWNARPPDPLRNQAVRKLRTPHRILQCLLWIHVLVAIAFLFCPTASLITEHAFIAGFGLILLRKGNSASYFVVAMFSGIGLLHNAVTYNGFIQAQQYDYGFGPRVIRVAESMIKTCNAPPSRNGVPSHHTNEALARYAPLLGYEFVTWDVSAEHGGRPSTCSSLQLESIRPAAWRVQFERYILLTAASLCAAELLLSISLTIAWEKTLNQLMGQSSQTENSSQHRQRNSFRQPSAPVSSHTSVVAATN